MTGSYIKSAPTNAKILATFSNKDNFYKAGWWPGHDEAKGHIMAFAYQENNKNLTVFSNDLTNNAHPQHQFRLLANSIFNATGQIDSQELAASFSDLKNVESWAGNGIRELVSIGALQGVGENRFEPLKQVTRAEFLAMIVRAFNLSDSKAKSSFADVASSSWYYPYVSVAVESNLVEGVGGRRFELNRTITREEMTQMAGNVLKLTKQTSDHNVDESLEKFIYRDTIAPYAREAVAVMTRQQVIQGLTSTTFGPKQNANRAQAAVMIQRMKHIID